MFRQTVPKFRRCYSKRTISFLTQMWVQGCLMEVMDEPNYRQYANTQGLLITENKTHEGVKQG